ncbi:MAG: hypothetical protein QNL61_07850 [Crocinitomicaceae bacterium]
MDVNRVELQTTSAYKYIYTVGSYASKSDAKSELPQIQSHGYNDAIVIKL